MANLSVDEKLDVIREVEDAYISAEEREFKKQQKADRKAMKAAAKK